MTTISTVSQASNVYSAPESVETTTASTNSFSQILTAAQSANTLLSNPESSLASRPDIKTFMDRTGADFLDASELIYGVVGSNTDERDWSAIMSADDPVSAARQATAQMYGRTDIAPRTDAAYVQVNDTVAAEGNFVVRQLKDDTGNVVDQGLKLTDAQGLILRDAGNTPQSIARNAWLFGFDTQPLIKLADAAASVSEPLGTAIRQTSTFASAPFAMNANIATKANDQSTSPSLTQAIEEATINTVSTFIDSATYLNSMFQA